MKKMIIVVMTMWIGSISFVNAGFSRYIDEPMHSKELKQKIGQIYKLKDVTKYGYVDKKGKWVIKPIFVYISHFDEYGYAVATQKGIPNKEYSDSPFERVMGMKVNGAKYGFINANGEWIIEPKYQELDDFESDGLAKAVKKEKKGYIDRQGSWYDTKEEYYAKYPDNKPREYAAKQTLKNRYKHCGDGVRFKYNYPYLYKDEIASYIDEKCQKKVEILNPMQLFSVGSIPIVKDPKTKKYGIFDYKNRKWKVEPQFDFEKVVVSAVGFNDGIVGYIVKKDGKYGIISNDGIWKIKPQFENLKDIEDDGLMRAENSNYKWGLIDKKGRWVVEPKFDDIGSLGDNGLRSAKTAYKGKYGYIDSFGTFYIKEKYDLVNSFRGGYAQVILDKKCGYINGKGKTIIPLEYDKCDGEGNFFKLSKNGKIGLMDVNRHWIIVPRKLKSIKVVDKYMIKVKYGNYEGYTDINGKPLTFTWDEVENVSK